MRIARERLARWGEAARGPGDGSFALRGASGWAKIGPTMPSYFADNPDLAYYFDRGLDWGALVRVTEFGQRTEGGFGDAGEARAFYREVAGTVGAFAAEEIAPFAAEIDREGVRFEGGEAVFPPRLAGVFDRLRALELHGMCLPRELGGLNCPVLLYLVTGELLARADVSVMAHHSFHGGMAMAMLVFSMHEGTTEMDRATGKILRTRFQGAIEEIARGEAWGCMDITETHAGSDMARIRALAEEDGKGGYLLSGQKIFITSGHGKYHFVLARTEKAEGGDDPFAGLAGLSMFLVKAYEDGPEGRRRVVGIDRVEEKLGHHGSVTAALHFDRAPAELVGRRGEGFKYMLTLMNNARLGVGFESIGLCEAALRAARAYAEGRESMGKPIARHEIVADYLEEMETDVVGLRALAMHGAFHEEMSQKLAIAERFGMRAVGLSGPELARERASHARKARRATPLLKYLAAEKAVEMARRCLQIHGGNGYMKDYPAEKLLRDACVMPIYEGTSQIQSLMAMKDTLAGAMKRPKEFLARLAQARWRSLSARDPLERRLARIQVLSLDAQQFLLTRTAATKLRALSGKPVSAWTRDLTRSWDPKRDFALAMLHAERLTRLLADEAVGEILFAQARRHEERRLACERYLERAEPRARFLHDEITSSGERLLRGLAGPEVREAAEA